MAHPGGRQITVGTALLVPLALAWAWIAYTDEWRYPAAYVTLGPAMLLVPPAAALLARGAWTGAAAMRRTPAARTPAAVLAAAWGALAAGAIIVRVAYVFVLWSLLRRP